MKPFYCCKLAAVPLRTRHGMGIGGSSRQHDTEADGRKNSSKRRASPSKDDSSRVVLSIAPDKPQTAKQRLLADAIPLIVSTAVFMW